MTRCLLIDDEPLARQLLRDYLKAHSDVEIIAECKDGFEALKAIQEHKPDLLFLDIQMPRISGFELIELMEEIPGIIFTTAFDEYAMQAFEASAVDYLLKPFSPERLAKALDKFRKTGKTANTQKLVEKIKSEAPADRIVVKNGADIRILPLSDIRYLEAYDDYVKIFTKTGMFLKKQSLQYFENSLDPALFVRIHRSLLLNLKEITRIEPAEKDHHSAVLTDKSRLPLSRSGYIKLKAALGIK